MYDAMEVKTGPKQKCLNEPGCWDYFISHTQRNANAVGLAEKLYASLEKRGRTAWLDVHMKDRSEAAMREGVVKAKCVIAILSGAVADPKDPSVPPGDNAYFARPFCVQELRWAVEAGVRVQPVVDRQDQGNIGVLLSTAPEDLRFLGSIDMVALDRSAIEYWRVGVQMLLEREPAADGLRAGQSFEAATSAEIVDIITMVEKRDGSKEGFGWLLAAFKRKGYPAYRIKCRNDTSTWTIHRRFNQFKQLRASLLEIAPPRVSQGKDAGD